MQIDTLTREFGRLEGTVWAHRKELIGRIEMARREVIAMTRKDGSRKVPWAQLATMGVAAIMSVLGIISPQSVAMIIKSLLH